MLNDSLHNMYSSRYIDRNLKTYKAVMENCVICTIFEQLKGIRCVTSQSLVAGRVGVDYTSQITISVPMKFMITVLLEITITIKLTITVTCLPWKTHIIPISILLFRSFLYCFFNYFSNEQGAITRQFENPITITLRAQSITIDYGCSRPLVAGRPVRGGVPEVQDGAADPRLQASPVL